jgi:tetratricopeptide (TPR) repeat protein/DNA-binding SARP family transcriptional activator
MTQFQGSRKKTRPGGDESAISVLLEFRVLDFRSMPTLELQLLGTPQVRLNGTVVDVGRKPLVLLSLLALGPAAGHWTRDALAPILWPDTPNPLPNLSVALGALRDQLGPQALGSDDKRNLWLEAGLTCDVLEVIEASRSPVPERWSQAWERSGEVLAFPEPQWDAKFALDFQDWLSETRNAFREAKRNLAANLGVRAVTLGEYRQAVTYLECVQPEASDPREAQASLLMLVLTALDQPERAVQVYQRLTEALHDLESRPNQDALAAFEIARDQQIAAARALLAERFPQHAETTEMPFVGRDTELEALEHNLPRSLEGLGWLTLITGEPGSGKTELARQAIEHLDARKRIYWHCEGFGERNAPAWRGFDLICRTLVRRRRAVFDAMPNELRAVLARFLPDVLEPVTEDPQPGDERLLYAAIRTLLTHDEQPTLLFLDDLQWFDEASLGLVLEVLRKPPPRGLLVIATFRDTEPPLTDNAQGSWARLIEIIHRDKHGQELALQPLNLEAVNALASELQPEANTDWMHAQSGGNPLYLLEMFDANYTQPGRVPPDLENLIRSRIDALPQRSIIREVLEACAVLGESTSLNEVKNVSGFDYDTTVQALGSLRDARLLQRAESRIQFNHNLTRDATLERLNLERAQLLNLRAARVRQDRPEFAAIHYWAALNQGQDNLPTEVMHEVVEVFSKAGMVESLRGDLEGGKRWFERALERTPDATTRVQTLTRRARIHERMLRYDDASSDLAQAEQLSGAVDPVTRAGVLNAQGLLLATCFGDADGCERTARLALTALGGLEHTAALTERANAFNNLGVSAVQRHDLDEAERQHRQALALRTALADTSGIAKSHHNIGVVLTSLGSESARTHYAEALTLFEQLGDRSETAGIYANLSWLEWRLGEYVSAELMCQRAIELTKPWDNDFNTHMIYNNLGAIRFFQGHYREAREAYNAALATPHASRNTHLQAAFLANLAEVEVYLGLYDEAERNLEKTLSLLIESPNSSLEAMVHWYSAEILAIRGVTNDANNKYQLALECARTAGLIEREAEILARLGRLLIDPVMTKQALEMLDTPSTRASDMTVRGNHQAAIQLLHEYGSIYEEMRLVADLTKITGDPGWSLEMQKLLEKLRSVD